MKRLTYILALCLFPICAGAQNLGGYFNRSYIHASDANPAFVPDSSTYISLPGLTASLQGNIGPYALLYPSSGGFVTGFHSDVSAEEFLGRIHDCSSLNVNARINLIGGGFRLRSGDYLSLSLAARAFGGVTAPKDLFRFLKEGTAGQQAFDLSSTAYDASAFAEMALGWAREFGPVRAGARIKLLYGGAHSELEASRLSVSASEKQWTISGDGAILSRTGGLNLGAAVDLGVKARVGELVTLSASIIDLGAISWADCSRYSQSGNTWTYGGLDDYIDVTDSESVSSIGDELQYKLDELQACMLFVRDAGLFKSRTVLPVSLLAGCEIEMPFWREMSAGAVLMHRGGSLQTLTDCRAVVNVRPVSWFECCINGGYSSCGARGGVLAVLGLGPVHAHLGGEFMGDRFGKYKALRIPIDNPSIMLDLGLNLVF